MPQIETQREDIKALRGLHIWHFSLSNCSQRVRMALYEKGASWESHHVNLPAGENLDPLFVALNPAGVVPVLVHNGRVYVESNDIIAYLDEAIPGPSLLPASTTEQEEVIAISKRTGPIQEAIKIVSFEFLYKPRALKSPEELAAYGAHCPNPKLVEFHREFSEGGGFGENKLREAIKVLEVEFAWLEKRLQTRPWLSGSQFGLADISWLVNVHRLSLMRFSFARYPKLNKWIGRCLQRPSSKAAIDAFEGSGKRIIFDIYSRVRALKGTSINNYR